MGKVSDLAKAVHGSTHQSSRATEKTPDDGGASKAGVQASRLNKKQIGGFFDPAVHKQLAGIAVEHETKIQNLLQEALNDLFTKYKKNRIA